MELLDVLRDPGLVALGLVLGWLGAQIPGGDEADAAGVNTERAAAGVPGLAQHHAGATADKVEEAPESRHLLCGSLV